MVKQRNPFRDGAGKNGSSRSHSKRERDLLTGAQLEFNSLNKRFVNLRNNILQVLEKEDRIIDFYERNSRPLFEKETAMKYDYLLFLDDAYLNADLTAHEKEILCALIIQESEGNVEDYLFESDKKKRLIEINRKYNQILYETTEEEFELEEVDAFLEHISIYYNKLSDKVKNAKSIDELLISLGDFLEARKKREDAKAKKIGFLLPEQSKPKIEKAETPKKVPTKGEVIEEFRTAKDIIELRTLFKLIVADLYLGSETEELDQKKEMKLNELEKACWEKDLVAVLELQADWLEKSVMKASQLPEQELLQFNGIFSLQINRLDRELEILNYSPFPEVEGEYGILRNHSLKDLPLQMNLIFNRHKKTFKEIETYVRGVSTISELKDFLKQYEKYQSENRLSIGDDMWDWNDN